MDLLSLAFYLIPQLLLFYCRFCVLLAKHYLSLQSNNLSLTLKIIFDLGEHNKLLSLGFMSVFVWLSFLLCRGISYKY